MAGPAGPAEPAGPAGPAGAAEAAEAAPPLPAVDYPWPPVAGSGLVTAEGFVPLAGHEGETRELLDRRLRRAGTTGLAERHPVIGVGSNRNAEVLRGKFATGGISPTLAVVPVEVEGIAVGHSAHVSARGYLAAAPFLAPGVRSVLTLAWLDDAQLTALDATEPNYQRLRLDPARVRISSDAGTARTAASGGVWIYRSRWGLVAGQDEPPSAPLPLGRQARVQARLGTVPALARAWPAGLTPAEVADRLAEPGLREQVRTALVAARLALPSGLGEGADR